MKSTLEPSKTPKNIVWNAREADWTALLRPVPPRSVDRSHVSKQVLTAHPLDADAAPDLALACEQYRLIRSRLLQICPGRRGNTFLVTSALAGDGKTMTSLNLSFSIALLPEKRVLFVELDLRRPSAHTMLGLRSEPGAKTFLESNRPWRECLWKLSSNLDGLLAFTPSHTPNESLNSRNLAVFLQEAAKEYDVVIIDSPPLLASIDTQAILPYVNNVLLLIMADKTPIRCVLDAVALSGEKTVGVILNGMKKLQYSDYYYGYEAART